MRSEKPERNVLASADVDRAQVLGERQPFCFFVGFFFDVETGANCFHFLFACGTRFRKRLQMLPTRGSYHRVAVSDSIKDVGHRNVFFCGLHHELSE